MEFNFYKLVMDYKVKHPEKSDKEIAVLLMPDIDAKLAGEKFSRLINGRTNLDKQSNLIIKMCEVFEIEPNKLLNYGKSV